MEKVNQVSKNLYRIFDEGTNAVAIIRSLLNYLVRVHKTQIEIKKTGNFDEAIKPLRTSLCFGKIKTVLETIVLNGLLKIFCTILKDC
jgi:DNA polymerase III delta subunit